MLTPSPFEDLQARYASVEAREGQTISDPPKTPQGGLQAPHRAFYDEVGLTADDGRW